MSEFNESQIITTEVQTQPTDTNTLRSRRDGRGSHVLPFELPEGIVVESKIEVPELPKILTMPIPDAVIETNHRHDIPAQKRFEEAQPILDSLSVEAQAEYDSKIALANEAELDAELDADANKRVRLQSFEYEIRALEKQLALLLQEDETEFKNRIDSIKQAREDAAKKLQNKYDIVELIRTMAVEGVTNFKEFIQKRDALIDTINKLVEGHNQLTIDLVSKKRLLAEYEGNLSACDETQDDLFDREAALRRKDTAVRKAFADPTIKMLSTQWSYPIEAFDDVNSDLPQGLREIVDKEKAEASNDPELGKVLISIADELAKIGPKTKRNEQLRARYASLFVALSDEIDTDEKELADFPAKSQALRNKLGIMLQVRATEFDVNSWNVKVGTERLSQILHGDTSDAAIKNLPPQFEPVISDILADQTALETRTGMQLQQLSPTFNDDNVLVALRTKPEEDVTVQELVQAEIQHDTERVQGLYDTIEAAQSINILDRIARKIGQGGMSLHFVDKPKPETENELENQIS